MNIFEIIENYVSSLERSLIGPVLFKDTVDYLVNTYGLVESVAAAIVMAYWSYKRTSDEYLKAFLENWAKNQFNEKSVLAGVDLDLDLDPDFELVVA